MPARGRLVQIRTMLLLEATPRHIRVCAIRAGAVLLVLTSILAAVLPRGRLTAPRRPEPKLLPVSSALASRSILAPCTFWPRLTAHNEV